MNPKLLEINSKGRMKGWDQLEELLGCCHMSTRFLGAGGGKDKGHHPSLGSLILKERKHLTYKEKRARKSYRKEALLPTGDPVWIFVEIRMVPQRVLSITKTSNPKERRHDDSHLSLRKRDWMISWEGSIASQRSDLETLWGRKHCFPQKARSGSLKFESRMVPQRAYSTTRESNPKERTHDDSHLSLKKRKLDDLMGRKHCFPEIGSGGLKFESRVVPQRAYSTTRGSNPKERTHDDSHLSLRKRNWKTFGGRKHCFP
ncbi:hypothetical protein M5K25_011920 [Dendrobium thyrsiflorum]|uniref:Uncharacterized protein n=1 Tax=Dendrobium thyrsiflorum TaxID=117978 RepID=A0ABD0V4E4_DENTH